MAKKDEQKAKLSSNGASKGRLQIFVAGFAVEGGDSVLADGFKAIRDLTEAMKSSGVMLPAPRAKAALVASGSDATAKAGTVVEETELPDSEVEETEDASENVIEGTPANGADRPKKKTIPPSCTIVKDLDITTGDMPLKTYVEQKGPKKAQDRVVVVAAWLKKYRGLEEITRHDLYTCYQQMGGSGDWKCMNDYDTFLRTLGSRKGWFTKGKKENSFEVTIVATNYVDGMTPSA